MSRRLDLKPNLSEMHTNYANKGTGRLQKKSRRLRIRRKTARRSDPTETSRSGCEPPRTKR
jgi:hypothetical protein